MKQQFHTLISLTHQAVALSTRTLSSRTNQNIRLLLSESVSNKKIQNTSHSYLKDKTASVSVRLDALTGQESAEEEERAREEGLSMHLHPGRCAPRYGHRARPCRVEEDERVREEGSWRKRTLVAVSPGCVCRESKTVLPPCSGGPRTMVVHRNPCCRSHPPEHSSLRPSAGIEMGNERERKGNFYLR